MTFHKKPLQVALTIAGSDPSGGAGIQADIKTFTALGVYGAAAINCLTVQNTQGVHGVHPVDPELVKNQISCVLNDLAVSHIKIGMLGSGPVASSIYEALGNFKGEIIYDPVLVSSSGHKLFDQNDYETIRNHILAICTVLTPNLPELLQLSDTDCSTKDALKAAVKKLQQQNKKLRSVIITGGHINPEEKNVTDYLFSKSEEQQFTYKEITHPRLATSNTHGTGCTFSAAFTAYHLLCGNDLEAFQKATLYMDTIIQKSASMKIGHGTGPLMHHLK